METDAMVSTNKELSISRLLNAPRDLVWKVWTEPAHIKNWWGPNGFTNTIQKMDLIPNGAWELIMHGPDGVDYKNKSIFREVIKPRLIVYDHISGPKFRMTITFSEQGNKTLLKISMIFETAEERENTVKVFKADIGLEQNIYKLEGYLKKVSAEKELTIERTFNAPRDVVFKAWTDAEQLAKWWGPSGFTNPVCKVDATPGGSILIDMQSPEGIIYPMDGVFHEVVVPEKLIFTAAALDKNGQRLFEMLNTISFFEEGKNKTRIHLHTAVSRITPEGKPYIEGMNQGWNESLDRLATIVVSSTSKTSVMKDSPLILERTYNAPVEKIWKAITDTEQMKQWYFPQLESFKPEAGFQTQFNVHNEGRDYLHIWKIREAIPLKKISVEWKYGGYPGNSLVTFELFPEGDKTRLVLTHEHIDSFLPGEHPELSQQNFVQGWTHFMEKGLREFVEG